MSNPMKYIRDLEAAGFQRNQAEAQVQMVLDAIEGDLVTRSDFAVFKEHIDKRFTLVDHRFDQVNHQFDQVNHQFRELELRMIVKLGLINVTTVTIAVAVLSWLIKVN